MRFPVEFAGSGKTAWVPAGSTVSEAAAAAGVPLPGTCGRRAVCGLCAIRVLGGALDEPTAAELNALTRAPDGVRLGCRARVSGPVTVKAVVPQPDLAFGETAGSGEPVVVAVDLGTTSVSAVALDAKTGVEVGRGTVSNAQQSFGADVLSRISAALAGQAPALRQAAETSILAAIELACPGCEIQRLVIAGNSAMAAILTGADVQSLAAAPFEAPTLRELPPDSGLRERVSEHAPIEVVRPVAAFVGGDVLCGLALVLAAGGAEASCLVDMGTNAEVAVLIDGRLTVASAPAGPAFEGWGTTSGGPAVPGAVSAVEVDGGSIALETIGDVEPLWFSGAGLVSAIAALRRVGHLDADGRLIPAGPLENRFTKDDDGVVAVRFGDESTPLMLTQLDVRNFQLAKAAVRVALEMTLAQTNVGSSRLRTLWVAGAFGQALAAQDLIDLGIVPCGAAGVIHTPGNTSLAGAVCFAMDSDALNVAIELAGSASSIELAGEQDFGAHLMRALALSSYDA